MIFAEIPRPQFEDFIRSFICPLILLTSVINGLGLGANAEKIRPRF